jgi:hypothetical protein
MGSQKDEGSERIHRDGSAITGDSALSTMRGIKLRKAGLDISNH